MINKNPKRQEVISAIEGEIWFQEKTRDEFGMDLDTCIDHIKDMITISKATTDEYKLETIRMVGALAVRSMEKHGVVLRDISKSSLEKTKKPAKKKAKIVKPIKVVKVKPVKVGPVKVGAGHGPK